MGKRPSRTFVAAALVLCIHLPSLLARQQPPTFRTSTTLVEVDVVVQDTRGRFRDRLRPEDFLVYEDGRPQRVEQAYLVTAGTARRLVGTADERVQETDLTLPDVRRTFVLYFDNAHMSVGALRRARAAAAQFALTDFRPGDACGIVFGRQMVRQRLMRTRGELLSALASLPVDPGSVMPERGPNDRKPPVADGGVVTPPPTDSRPHREDGALDFEFSERTGPRQSLEGLAHLSDRLVGYPGRKTIIFFSDGFVVPGLTPGSGRLAAGEWDAVRRAIESAARAAVRIYVLDTRGLDRGSASSAILTAEKPAESAADSAAPLGPDASDTLNTIGVDTGGRCIRNENDFTKAVHEIATEVSSYYVLGYRSSNATPDGRFRRIRVSVNRAGSVVRARKGYVAGTSPAGSGN